MKKLVLFGAGSRLAHEYDESCTRLGIEIMFCVQNTPDAADHSHGILLKLVGELTPHDIEAPFLVPLFTPKNRRTAFAHAKKIGFTQSAILVDPTAIIARSVTIGDGCFVNAGNVIGAAGHFGEHVTINRGCSIGHHALFHDFVSIGPGCTVCGDVTIGEGALIGAGAVILPGISIGENSVVGAGTVVARDVPPNTKLIDKSKLTLSTIKKVMGAGRAPDT